MMGGGPISLISGAVWVFLSPADRLSCLFASILAQGGMSSPGSDTHLGRERPGRSRGRMWRYIRDGMCGAATSDPKRGSHGRSLVFDARESLCRWWRQRGISAAGGTLRAWPADAGLIVLAKLVFFSGAGRENEALARTGSRRPATVDGHRRLHLHLGELR